LETVDVGTPHIAGYSYDGKVNGTAMVYAAACWFLGVEPQWDARQALAPAEVECIELDAAGRSDEEMLHAIVSRVYPLERDDEALRRTVDMTPDARGREFDRLRKDYPQRREFHNTRVRLAGASGALRATVQALGFQLDEQRGGASRS
jgi:erythronate-4-phosphate dehydrogenase